VRSFRRLDGRGLADTDRAGAPLVVAVNQRLAQQLASGGSAIGQPLTFDFGNEWAIRLAVGARSHDLQKLVLRQSVAYAAAGSAVDIVLLIAVASPYRTRCTPSRCGIRSL
jgi:hypothetical protein